MSNTSIRVKNSLWERFRNINPKVKLDNKGYVAQPVDNLLDPAWLEWIRPDYEKGSGNELRGKFCAVHSSAALAANHFAIFKKQRLQLALAGSGQLASPVFEKQLPTGLRGTPPNLDVFFTASNTVVAIEAKLMEILSRKKPKFSPRYERCNWPECDDHWWRFVETAQSAPAGFLDTAQLVKHYLGLICFLRGRPDIGKASLLYLYWKPTNTDSLPEYQDHERELAEFKVQAVSRRIDFVALCYSDLWQAWSQEPSLSAHAKSLMQRYSVAV